MNGKPSMRKRTGGWKAQFVTIYGYKVSAFFNSWDEAIYWICRMYAMDHAGDSGE